MVAHLRKSCLNAQFEVIKKRLTEKYSYYNTKEKLIEYYPDSVGFFPQDVKQVAYKSNAKFPIKQASKKGDLIQIWKAGEVARYAFPIKIVESMIDQILENDKDGYCIVDGSDNIISKPFDTQEEAQIELLKNDRYLNGGGYGIFFFKKENTSA
ncbi:hypothetical protein [Halarcobacter anaerophilus]|uniref:Uncharacterized protein n=1 Tax=Halarcobacter anaerophilus TaxID=877500 RepID=A0A4Q0Y2Z1_9BACT|nr:hypothetical protein [Halarcobacter anaerophilus]QDF28959.1 hypothetical protein AANAER_1479 [Halarcobacter anaerophilus]RXJ63594.1 hypothetical protein CRV06_05220 [Halarcobacter anaerophilus]